MNQLLDSRVEALAFKYVSFGIFTVVNNLWTWVAVITAAVSFWRIRAAGAATSSCSVKSHDQSPLSSIIDRLIHEVEEKMTVSPVVSISSPASVKKTAVSRSACNDGATKGGMPKLTVYYYNDIGGENDDEGGTTETEWCDGDKYRKEESCGGEWWEGWERVLKLRKGETGWHRYQDLTAINGNVVRLWDDSCRRGRYSSSRSVW
ncbi:Plant invertase/pectin methylesterase inhibitor superfamily protein [Hibiscus syriacus]|uniref:Plant invertase/pectin methylesterase inhibitor superfamily protein n=2 Tax=Hibiscus syriacus TaxID=106335 RepID=A0A6A2XKC3_HIBSY|nr:Plant invertase/pectin methylesterase inhibitor superfamily protein [Hibiscus syriacus]